MPLLPTWKIKVFAPHGCVWNTGFSMKVCVCPLAMKSMPSTCAATNVSPRLPFSYQPRCDMQTTSAQRSCSRSFLTMSRAATTGSMYVTPLKFSALITAENFKGVTYMDPVVAARDMVKKLREQERCALVVCMSHLGWYEDGKRGDTFVAAQVDGIDFIASGHTHTFMEKPVFQTQPCGAKTLIFQVGKSGIYVGRVDFTFRSGKVAAVSARLLDTRNA